MSGLVAAALLLAAFALRWPDVYTFFAARHWAGRLATAPAAELESILEQLAVLGPAGLPPLVQSLDSPRVELAESAHRVLADRIDAWGAQPEGDAPVRLAALATRLAEQSEPFGPRGRARAAELAARLLRGRLKPGRLNPGIDPASAEIDAVILDACAAVLRCGGNDASACGTTDPSPLEAPPWQSTDVGTNGPAPSPHRPNHPAGTPGEDPRGPEAGHDGLAWPRVGNLGADPARVALLPGGGLSVPELSWPTHSADGRPEPGAETAAAPPGLLPPELTAPAAARPLAPVGADPGRAGVDVFGTPGAPASKSPGFDGRSAPGPRAGRTDRDRAIEGRLLSTEAAVDGSPATAGRDTPADLTVLDEAAVVRRLHAPERVAAASAEQELARRGFSSAQIDLARRLHDPDVNVRRELATLVTRTPGINPTPWLLELAQDSDAEVRLTALGLLLTASDPNVAAQAARLAAGDDDPRVRRMAERLVRQNRAPGKAGP